MWHIQNEYRDYDNSIVMTKEFVRKTSWKDKLNKPKEKQISRQTGIEMEYYNSYYYKYTHVLSSHQQPHYSLNTQRYSYQRLMDYTLSTYAKNNNNNNQ